MVAQSVAEAAGGVETAEGGAIEKVRSAHPMGGFMAKIRRWLRLDKKS